MRKRESRDVGENPAARSILRLRHDKSATCFAVEYLRGISLGTRE